MSAKEEYVIAKDVVMDSEEDQKALANALKIEFCNDDGIHIHTFEDSDVSPKQLYFVRIEALSEKRLRIREGATNVMEGLQCWMGQL